MCLVLYFYIEMFRVSLLATAGFVLPEEFVSESEIKVESYVVLQGV